jgi:hypothetical protein
MALLAIIGVGTDLDRFLGDGWQLDVLRGLRRLRATAGPATAAPAGLSRRAFPPIAPANPGHPSGLTGRAAGNRPERR